jgi:Domain of unknown function (DUF2383)
MAHADSSVEMLNSFLRQEVSAVESYRRALETIRDDLARRTLEDCQHDHEARIESLRHRIEKLGGKPADVSRGPWDGVSPAEGDERTAIQALEAGEAHELEDYERDVGQTHGEARRFVRMELLPRQKRTHDRLGKLMRTLH